MNNYLVFDLETNGVGKFRDELATRSSTDNNSLPTIEISWE